MKKEADAGQQLKFLFFWGHTPTKDGSVSKTCFSQWWKAAFTKKEDTYKTAEHFMMSEKARLFNDSEIRTKIIACEHPAEAKKLGRKVANFDPKIWDEQKYAIVKEANYLKFSQHTDLKEFLLNTKDRILVEASPVDAIWGIGLAQNDSDAQNPNLWQGENLLGFALMEVRDEINSNLC
ncbi:MAG: NADAR family protein [Maribacter sp.]